MSYRLMALLPLLWGAAFLAGDALFFGTPHYNVYMRAEVELVKALALFGSWAAAAAFERGDYLRRAWFLIGGCMALLLVRDLTLAPLGWQAAVGERRLELLRGLLVLAANVSQVVGTWILARAWKVAGLYLPGSHARRMGVVAAVGFLSLAIAGPAIVANLQRVMAGDMGALALAASGLGDVISLWLIAPLLLTALALRGGLFGWPWALITTSMFAWMLYDALPALAPTLGLGPHAARTAGELFRALGCMFGFTAGLAQRSVVAGLRRATGS